jgi:hypothetical protein
MYYKEQIGTSLPDKGNWAILSTETDDTFCSSGVNGIAQDLGMQADTLVSLLKNASDGSWPAILGGKIFIISSAELSPGFRLVSLKASDSGAIADLLFENTCDDIFILISPDRRIHSMSREAISIFGNDTEITSLFDSSSSGAIQAAIHNCLKYGSTPGFLISHSSEGGNRSNYSITMRKLSSPGRLIFCRLIIPSVAVVTGTIDRKSWMGVLLEESFCPTIVINSEGLIISMNEVARGVCQQMWGTNPTGSPFFELVHPDHRKAAELRHEQRVKGYAVPTRFTVKMQPSTSGADINIGLSVVQVPDTNQWVVFARIENIRPEEDAPDTSDSLPDDLMTLLNDEGMTPQKVLEKTMSFTGAASAAFVREGEVITVGDARELIPFLDPIQLAASKCGFREDGIHVNRIHSGFGVSHIVLQGIRNQSFNLRDQALQSAASLVLGAHEARIALREQHRILSTVKSLAASYLRKNEPLDGLLSDLSRECGAEITAVFKVSANGNALKGIGASGIAGRLPELPLDALNTASWACLRGEIAFFAETPGNDLRFSPVFPNSRSELAVPFFCGSTPDGVILLASTEIEAFHFPETEMIQLMAILFTVPEAAPGYESESSMSHNYAPLKGRALDYIVYSITALNSASLGMFDSLKKSAEGNTDIEKNVVSLTDAVTRLGFLSRWAVWWLRISVYGGVPDQKWIDPVPLLEKSLRDFRRVSEPAGIKLSFQPPENDIEVCTDGSFVSMIAHSLLMCILDNCKGCNSVILSIDRKEDHWTFGFDSTGGSIPGECLSMDRQPDRKNIDFALAWKLTEELGGTVSTFSSKGKATRMIIRLRVSG